MLTRKDPEKTNKELYWKEMSFFEIVRNWHMIYKCTPSKVTIHDETDRELLGKVIEFN